MPLRDVEREIARSILAVDAFAALVALLRLDRESGDGTGIQPLQADRLAGFFAIAVLAVLDAREGCVYLVDELALPIARPEFESAVGLRRRAVSKIGVLDRLLVQSGQRLARLADD